MKLIVIGSGQCGNRIADEFYRMDKWTRFHRHIRVIADAFAVNTDTTDLSGLRYLPKDFKHRIPLGERKTGGHGVGKINEKAAEIAYEERQKIVDAVESAHNLFEADAFLVIGSAGGGTGSGSVPVIVSQLKEKQRKPVYALVVLPYEHEELNERTRLNTAMCLRATYDRADAVILVDNQRYMSLFGRVADNFELINRQIANSFRDLLCAGEELKRKYVGSRVVDAGDIIESLEGWTAIGWGGFDVPLLPDFRRNKSHFISKTRETLRGIGAAEKAVNLISVQCSSAEYLEAQKGLYLYTAPPKELNQDIIREVEGYLKDIMPEAIIRGGDYPRPEKGAIEATVILSKMSRLQRLEEIFTKGGDERAEREKERLRIHKEKVEELKKLSQQVPDLFENLEKK
jgi:cell division GTPase FtsZ